MKLITLSTFFLCISVFAQGTLGAMGKLKNPRAKLPALPANMSTPTDKPEEIKLTIDNQLPEGLVIRALYKNTLQEPDLYLKSPGLYTRKIKVFVIKDGKPNMLTALLFIDHETGTIEKNMPAHEVVPGQKIVIFRTHSQSHHLEPIRHSPTSVLMPIAEEDEEEDNTSQEPFNKQPNNALREKREKIHPYFPTQTELERGRKAYQDRSTLPPLTGR